MKKNERSLEKAGMKKRLISEQKKGGEAKKDLEKAGVENRQINGNQKKGGITCTAQNVTHTIAHAAP